MSWKSCLIWVLNWAIVCLGTDEIKTRRTNKQGLDERELPLFEKGTLKHKNIFREFPVFIASGEKATQVIFSFVPRATAGNLRPRCFTWVLRYFLVQFFSSEKFWNYELLMRKLRIQVILPRKLSCKSKWEFHLIYLSSYVVNSQDPFPGNLGQCEESLHTWLPQIISHNYSQIIYLEPIFSVVLETYSWEFVPSVGKWL